jgi:hypothetical protein
MWVGQTSIDPLTAPFHVLDQVTFAALIFTTQKNTVRGEVIGHGRTNSSFSCPTVTIVRRIKHLRSHGAPAHTPLCAVGPSLRPHPSQSFSATAGWPTLPLRVHSNHQSTFARSEPPTQQPSLAVTSTEKKSNCWAAGNLTPYSAICTYSATPACVAMPLKCYWVPPTHPPSSKNYKSPTLPGRTTTAPLPFLTFGSLGRRDHPLHSSKGGVLPSYCFLGLRGRHSAVQRFQVNLTELCTALGSKTESRLNLLGA